MPSPPTFRPVLIAAPHLVYPTRNGADILVDRTAKELSGVVPFVDVVGSRETIRYVDGEIKLRHHHTLTMRPRWLAAIRTIVLRSHYFKEKFITPRFQAAIVHTTNSTTYGTFIGSYTVTYDSLVPVLDPSQRVILLTHNDEFVWFENLKQAAGNPLDRQVARSSLNFLRSWFKKARPGVIFAHVSERDKVGYSEVLLDSVSVVVPIGADIPEAPVPPTSSKNTPLTLLFVGSLGIKMNGDALAHFESAFAPILTSNFPFNVIVAGSNPSRAVREMCELNGWSLKANVSDEELRTLFESSDFSILPFEYSTGSKLKLVGTLAHGVPFLATHAVSPTAEFVVPPCTVSNDPMVWADSMARVMEKGISRDERNDMFEAAKRHSWAKSVEHLLDFLS